eukprot:gene14524-16030_t
MSSEVSRLEDLLAATRAERTETESNSYMVSSCEKVGETSIPKSDKPASNDAIPSSNA